MLEHLKEFANFFLEYLGAQTGASFQKKNHLFVH